MSPRWGSVGFVLVLDRGFAPSAIQCHPFGVAARGVAATHRPRNNSAILAAVAGSAIRIADR